MVQRSPLGQWCQEVAVQPGDGLHAGGCALSGLGHGDAGDEKEQDQKGEGDGKEQREGRRGSLDGQGSH